MSISNQEIKTPSAVLAHCRELDIKIVSLRFTDLRGEDHGILIPVHELREEAFEYGFALSSVGLPGFPTDRMSELVLVPLPATSFFDPFAQIPTLNLLGALRDAVTDEDHEFDSRAVAQRASGYLAGAAFADRVSIRVDINFEISDSLAAASNSADLVYAELLRQLTACRVQIDSQFLRVPSLSDGRISHVISVRADCAVRAADAVMMVRYLLPRIANSFGAEVRLTSDADPPSSYSGMTVSLCFFKANEPIMTGTEYAGLSTSAMGVIGGLLSHARSLLALGCPLAKTRFEAKLEACSGWLPACSREHPSTLVRIPTFASGPKSKRIDFRGCDASCNPYLAISAILMAAIEGGLNKFNPGTPCEPGDDDRMNDQRTSSGDTSQDLTERLDALRSDRDFLTRGDVFSETLLDRWMENARNAR